MKNLNEQISRIRTMMNLNEDDSQYMAALEQSTNEFNEKAEEDLTPDEFQEVVCAHPDSMDVPENTGNDEKQKFEEFKRKLKTSSIAELKAAKKQLKELRRQAKQQPQQQNEQAGTMVTLLGVTMPHGFALVIGGIALIMVLNVLFSLLGIHLIRTVTDWCTGRQTRGVGIRFGRD